MAPAGKQSHSSVPGSSPLAAHCMPSGHVPSHAGGPLPPLQGIRGTLDEVVELLRVVMEVVEVAVVLVAGGEGTQSERQARIPDSGCARARSLRRALLSRADPLAPSALFPAVASTPRAEKRPCLLRARMIEHLRRRPALDDLPAH